MRAFTLPASILLLAIGQTAIQPTALAAPVAPVYKTGQTTCYDSNGLVISCADSGQDGEYQAGATFSGVRFSDNGNGTITDNKSGLVWLKDAYCDNQMRTFSQAIDFTAGLANGQCGLSDGSTDGDWRLPNILELLSLVDYGHIDPALPTVHPFSNIQLYPVSPFYWSNTTHNDRVEADSPRQAFTLNMRTGEFYYHLKDGAYFVLAVKKNSGNGPLPVPKTGQTTCYDPSGTTGNTISCAGSGQDGEFLAGTAMPVPRFTDNADGTVTDQLTGLVWVKDANCWNNKFYWSKAPSKAAETAHGNCGLTDGSLPGDWRVPNVRELLSLMDFENTGPTLPTGHPFTNVVQLSVHSYYWTSTNYTDVNFGYTKGNLVLDFRKGYEYNRLKSDSWYLWLVRDPGDAATADRDGDGLNNLVEYQQGTDPLDNDSDADGLLDGWEGSPMVMNLNACGDGVSDVTLANRTLNWGEEFSCRTNGRIFVRSSLRCADGAKAGLVANEIVTETGLAIPPGCRMHWVTPERAAARSHADP
jgi:hypothetical protein